MKINKLVIPFLFLRQRWSHCWNFLPKDFAVQFNVQYGAQFSATFDVNLYFLPQRNRRNSKCRPELTTLFSFLL